LIELHGHWPRQFTTGLERGRRDSNPQPPDREFEEATQRVRYSIALLEEYEAGEPYAEPWVYLEYYCHACMLRMNWPGFVPAYLDPE
jgi:hypothetical protein